MHIDTYVCKSATISSIFFLKIKTLQYAICISNQTEGSDFRSGFQEVSWLMSLQWSIIFSKYVLKCQLPHKNMVKFRTFRLPISLIDLISIYIEIKCKIAFTWVMLSLQFISTQQKGSVRFFSVFSLEGEKPSLWHHSKIYWSGNLVTVCFWATATTLDAQSPLTQSIV